MKRFAQAMAVITIAGSLVFGLAKYAAAACIGAPTPFGGAEVCALQRYVSGGIRVLEIVGESDDTYIPGPSGNSLYIEGDVSVGDRNYTFSGPGYYFHYRFVGVDADRYLGVTLAGNTTSISAGVGAGQVEYNDGSYFYDATGGGVGTTVRFNNQSVASAYVEVDQERDNSGCKNGPSYYVQVDTVSNGGDLSQPCPAQAPRVPDL